MKKIIALFCAVAIAISGMVFTPQSVSAAMKSVTAPEGGSAEGTEGAWTYTVIAGENQYGDKWPVTAYFGDCDTVKGFSATLDAYCYDGSYWRASDIKNLCKDKDGKALEEGEDYKCKLTIKETPDKSTEHAPITVRTMGGILNLEKETKTSTGNDLVWEGTVSPSKTPLELQIGYGNDLEGHALNGYSGKFEITDITFEKTNVDPTSTWYGVPNEDDNYFVGPWNLFNNFIDGTGNYGIIKYKQNVEHPTKYSDYSIRAASVSGWEAYSVFARLKTYCSDYLDEGDPYDVTIKLNSTKGTVKTPQEDDLDQLLIIVGADPYYKSLVAGENVIKLHGDSYSFDHEKNTEQIMFELDGLQKNTEITVKDIQITTPDQTWTNVPNKKDTTVGPWTLFGWQDDTHWSKMAYRENASGTGLGAYDIKVRRTTSNGSFSSMAALATLTDYLETAKDTKDRVLSVGDDYDVKFDINASSYGNTISNYGRVRVLANGKAFDLNLKPGKNTYDLYEITGNKFTFDDQKSMDVQFELDEVTPRSILNISNLEIIGPDDNSQEVPNASAYKPEGTPWTLYAITDTEQEKYGAMRYEIDGDPAVLSSTKMILKSVSGWFGANSIKATLNGRLSDLEVGKRYRIVAKVKIDESKVLADDKKVSYAKQLRAIVDNQNFDFDVKDGEQGVYTFEKNFIYHGDSKHVQFDFDQLLRGSIVSFESVDITDPVEPTTAAPTTQAPTTEAPSTEAPTEVTTEAPQTTPEVTTSQAATTKVKAPGKAKIKKIYKRKFSAKKMKVSLKKIKGAKGYQIAVYKTKKNAKKNKKALVKKYTKKVKYTIKSKKLKGKKKVYVKARAYVLGTNGKKVFGKWSAIKVGKLKKTSKYYPYYY